MRPLCLVIALLLVACNNRGAVRLEHDAAPSLAPSPIQPRLTWQDAPASQDPVESLVQAATMHAISANKTLVVYVGGASCEPCERFHRAAKEGTLDADLSDIYVLAFDLERDGERLRSAGYTSRYIPLFAIPRSDGRASGKQMEGSIKGAGAVADITPRLRRLVRP